MLGRVSFAVSLLLAVGLVQGPGPDVPSPQPAPDAFSGQVVAGAVPDDVRVKLLGPDGDQVDDTAVAVVGDSQGVTVLSSSAATGYSWAAVATLTVDGVQTDRWIANWCLTEGATKVVVVYGTRSMTNREEMLSAGGWASIVDLRTGAVTSLGRGYTMAYFNPGCGAGNDVALSAFDAGKTRVTLLDTSTMSSKAAVSVKGQYTSAVPDEKGGLLAAGAEGIVRLNSSGSVSKIAAVAGTAFGLITDSAGQLTYLVGAGDTSTVFTMDPLSSSSRPRAIAKGSLTGTGIARDGTGKVSLLAAGGLTLVDKGTPVVKAPAGSKLSSTGRLAIASSSVDVPLAGVAASQSAVKIAAVSSVTGELFEFKFSKPDASPSTSSGRSESVRPSSMKVQTLGAPVSVARLAGSSTDPVESE